MSTFNEILAIINSGLQGSELVLQRDSFTDPSVIHLFDTILGQEQLVFQQQQQQDLVVEDENQQIIYTQGLTSYLEYENIFSTLIWTITGDIVDLTLNGNLGNITVNVPVLIWISLREPGFTAIVNDSDGIISTNRHGNLYMGETRVPLFLYEWGNDYYEVQIGEQQNPFFQLSNLESLASLFGSEINLTSFLPTSLETAINGIAITNVSANIFNDQQWVTSLSMGFCYSYQGDLSGIWEIIPGIALRNLEGNLTVKNPICNVDLDREDANSFDGMGYNSYNIDYLISYFGELRATFLLGQTEIPIRIAGGNIGYWEMGLQPNAEIVLPSLENLFALMGEQNLFELLPSGIQDIPQAFINKLFLQFDPEHKELVELSFAIGSAGTWTVIENYLTVESIYLDMRMVNGSSGYQIFTDISSIIQIGDVYLQMDLFKPFTEPNWTLSGSLIEGEIVDLTGIAQRLLHGFVTLPDTFPTITFNEIEFSVTPQSQIYHFAASSNDTWPIYGSLLIADFAIEFDYNNTIYGSVSGNLVITSSDAISETDNDPEHLSIALSVVLETGNHPGWLFTGNFTSSSSEENIQGSDLIDKVAGSLGIEIPVPAVLANFAISAIDFSYQTGTGDLLFSCAGEIPDLQTSVSIEFALVKSDTAYDYQFRGTMLVNNLEFSLVFDDNPQQSQALGVYYNLDQGDMSIHDLVAALSEDLGAYVPQGLTFAVKDALIAYQSANNIGKGIFALDVDGGIQLSNIPLIGSLFSTEDTLSFSIKPVVTSDAFSEEEVRSLLNLLPNDNYSLPIQNYDSRFQFITQLQFPGSELLGDTFLVDLPITTNSSGELEYDANNPAVDDASWWNIQKNFGPIHFGKIGFQYKDNNIWLYPQAEFTTDHLSISLDGFAIYCDLDTFIPHFAISGLEIVYDTPELVVEGAFLKSTYEENGVSYDEYSGLALLEVMGMSLSAIGSYAYYENAPSLFLYASVHIPMGGPPIFFVTGLAAGFGFNRRLIVPAIDQVQTFPLVEQAVGPETNSAGTVLEQIRQEIDTLHDWIPPSIGDQFLAIGIQFTSYKMIDSFALLIVGFGNRFVIDILGMSSLIIPCSGSLGGLPPLAQVEMVLQTTFDPQQGFFGAEAQLTSSSYVFSRDCHITGGFAFYVWLSSEHQGDFVQSIGGYHSQFDVPSHYPKVPLLGLDWTISSELAFKGGVYFALTPHALMAGGHLEATWDDGDFCAWFSAGVDFLLGWQPYYYDARLQIDVGVSYHLDVLGIDKTFSAHAGVSLHIWGPEFAGEATINLSIISFTISFGESQANTPSPLLWSEFTDSFLPDSICSITVEKGLLREFEGDSGNKEWIIDGNNFSATLESVIPSVGAYLENGSNNEYSLIDEGSSFGVASMDINTSSDSPQENAICTNMTVSIKNSLGEDKSDLFTIVGSKKNLPCGLWGKEFQPKVNQESMIENALTGIIFTLINSHVAQEVTIERDKLMTDPRDIAAISFVEIATDTYSNENETQRRNDISTSISDNSNRDAILTSMGIHQVADCIVLRNAENLANSYVVAPQLT